MSAASRGVFALITLCTVSPNSCVQVMESEGVNTPEPPAIAVSNLRPKAPTMDWASLSLTFGAAPVSQWPVSVKP